MNTENYKYIQPHLSAYLRGKIIQSSSELCGELTDKLLSELVEEDFKTLMDYGIQHSIKLHHFKIKGDLPRVKQVLGFLHSINPQSILDVGSGRGVFLFPFMRDFPFVPVTSLDVLPNRVEMLQCMTIGGMENLTALNKNICTWDAQDESYDVVTMLEVLEHIPDAEMAVRNAVRIAKRYIVVSVPSKPDNNPEHIHLFNKKTLTDMFLGSGCNKLNFSGVNGHLILFASK